MAEYHVERNEVKKQQASLFTIVQVRTHEKTASVRNFMKEIKGETTYFLFSDQDRIIIFCCCELK